MIYALFLRLKSIVSFSGALEELKTFFFTEESKQKKRFFLTPHKPNTNYYKTATKAIFV